VEAAGQLPNLLIPKSGPLSEMMGDVGTVLWLQVNRDRWATLDRLEALEVQARKVRQASKDSQETGVLLDVQARPDRKEG